jgi:hypothetical protein
MYSIAKLLRRSVEDPWVRYNSKKNGEKNQKGPNVFIEPMGGVEIFQGNP